LAESRDAVEALNFSRFFFKLNAIEPKVLEQGIDMK
jgi:hypothetical protein